MMNSNVIQKGNNGMTQISLETWQLSKRHICIEGEIDAPLADRFRRQMEYLVCEDPEAVITVEVNSPGGDVRQGLMIYDILQAVQTPVRMVCTGMAASMAALIFAGGNHGRYVLPHSELMIHQPLILGGMGGSAGTVREISDSLLKTRRMLDGILAKHTGKTRKEIEKATAGPEHWFDAGEAVEFGLADGIATYGEFAVAGVR